MYLSNKMSNIRLCIFLSIEPITYKCSILFLMSYQNLHSAKNVFEMMISLGNKKKQKNRNRAVAHRKAQANTATHNFSN